MEKIRLFSRAQLGERPPRTVQLPYAAWNCFKSTWNDADARNATLLCAPSTPFPEPFPQSYVFSLHKHRSAVENRLENSQIMPFPRCCNTWRHCFGPHCEPRVKNMILTLRRLPGLLYTYRYTAYSAVILLCTFIYFLFKWNLLCSNLQAWQHVKKMVSGKFIIYHKIGLVNWQFPSFVCPFIVSIPFNRRYY